MKLDIVRAWKDEAYRLSLSEEQLSSLPPNPAGEMELTDAELDSVYGGFDGEIINGVIFSFAASCQNFHFSVTVITGEQILVPLTIICVKNG